MTAAAPSLFIGHGSPTYALDQNEYTQFLNRMAAGLGRPDAIVLFTAHWESKVVTISSTDDVYEMIYDFGGFSDELFRIRYPAKGSKQIAANVQEMLKAKGIAAVTDEKRGLDHGTWVILSRIYPKADIPVVQVSVNPFLHPSEQFAIGEALRGLGKMNVMVIGSGATVHNLRIIKWGQREAEPWAEQFDDWLIERIQNRRLDELFDYAQKAPYADIAVPRPEHFVPLFIALGAGDPGSEPIILNRSYDYGTLSNLCYRF